MKYSSFAIALLLNVTFVDAIHAAPEDAPKDDDKKAPAGPPPHGAHHGPPPHGAHHGPPPHDAHQGPHGKPPVHHEHVKIHKSTIEYAKEDKDTEKALKKEKIDKLKKAYKEDVTAPPAQAAPLDGDPILEALQAGDALAKKQKKEAEEKNKKISMKSIQVPVLPAKMWDIDEAKPLKVKEVKPDPEDVKDEDDEKCKFKGDVNEKFEALLEAYKKASDIVENEGYKNKW